MLIFPTLRRNFLYSDLDYLLAGDSWAGVGVAEFLFAPIKFTLVQKSWTVTRLFVPRSILSLLGVWRTEILGKTKSSLVKLVALKVLRFLTLRSGVNGKKQNEASLKFPLKKRKLQVWVVSRSKTEIFEFFFFCWSFGVRAWKLAEKETRNSGRKKEEEMQTPTQPRPKGSDKARPRKTKSNGESQSNSPVSDDSSKRLNFSC